MKKITLTAVAFIAITFASCKKDYTCTCTSTGSSTPSVTKIIGVKKSAATANCVSKTTTSNGSTDITTCTLSK
jgi:hypothetical protein